MARTGRDSWRGRGVRDPRPTGRLARTAGFRLPETPARPAGGRGIRLSTWGAPGGCAPAAADRGGQGGPGQPRTKGTRAWRWYLAGGGLAWALYPAVGWLPLASMPAELARAILYWLIGLSAVVAIWAAIRLHRPPTPLAWSLLAVGLLFFVLGDIVLFGEPLLGTDEYPSPADALYLIGYPLIAAGLLVLVRARSRGRERTALTDALIITIGIGLVAWALILKPSVSDETLSLAGTLISVAYPLMDLLLLATAVRLAVGRARSTAALVLLLTGLFSQLVADTVY